MIRRWGFLALCAAGVVACNDASDADREVPPAPSPTTRASASPSATPPTAPGPEPERTSSGARAAAEETDDFLFEYTYPAKAGRIPELAALLDRRLEERRSDLVRSAAIARREARADGFPYNKHSYSAEWEVVADLPNWLSLSNEFSTYTGGAHGNVGMESLVWNKEQERAMEGIDLFTSPAALEEALDERFCEGLNRLREERRGEAPDEAEQAGEDTPFSDCPDISELTVLVGSASGRAFDRLTLYAGPYVAGPYAEGAYEVPVRVDAAVRQAVRPEYRDSFATRK